MDAWDNFYPELSPEERFLKIQEQTLELIRQDEIYALLEPDGDVRYMHPAHCTPEMAEMRLKPEQVEQIQAANRTKMFRFKDN